MCPMNPTYTHTPETYKNVLIVTGTYTNMNSGFHNHQIGMDYLYDAIFKMATSEVKLRYCL